VFDLADGPADPTLGFFSSFRCWEFGVICDDDDPEPRDMPGDGTPSGRVNCTPRVDSPYMTNPQDYIDFLKGLKPDPNRVLVAGIIGVNAQGVAEPVQVRLENIDDDADLEHNLMPACETAGIGKAAPGTRLKAFLDGFPNRNITQTICPSTGDLSGALQQIAELLARVTGTPCLEGDLYDADPDQGGVQPDCRVSDVQYKDTDREIETSMPPCALAGGATPCFNIISDPGQCSEFPTQLAIEIDRGGGEAPPETTLVVRCQAE
jgi:hypothetical protein